MSGKQSFLVSSTHYARTESSVPQYDLHASAITNGSHDDGGLEWGGDWEVASTIVSWFLSYSTSSSNSSSEPDDREVVPESTGGPGQRSWSTMAKEN